MYWNYSKYSSMSTDYREKKVGDQRVVVVLKNLSVVRAAE